MTCREICTLQLLIFISIASEDPDIADIDSEREMLHIRQPAANHNAGQLFFLDGYLFVSLGDGGGAGDPYNRHTGHGQDKFVNMHATNWCT